MGRFYKTTKQDHLDYMYKLPEQYMLGAVQQASDDLTQNQAALFDMYGKLELNALSPDKEAAKQLLDNYEQKINTLTSELQADPLGFRKRTGDIMRLSRDLQKEFSSGKAAAIQGNYNAYQTQLQDWKKTAREKQLANADWIPGLAQKSLSEYANKGGAAYDDTTGDYNTYMMDDLANHVDIDEKLSEIGKEYEPHIRAWADAGLSTDGNFIVETSGKTETKSAHELLQAMTNQIMTDAESMRYIKQGSEIGALQGYYKEDGDGMEYPYSIDEKGNIEYKGTLGAKLQAAINKYARNNTTAARETWKNVSGKSGSGRTTVNDLGHLVNTKTGTITQSAYPHAFGESELPTDNVGNFIATRKSVDYKRNILNERMRNRLNSLSSAMMQNNRPAEEVETVMNKIHSAINAEGGPNYEAIKQAFESIPENNGDLRAFRDSYLQIRNDEEQALNAEVQLKMFDEISAITGVPVNELYADPAMQTVKLDINESQGAWYDMSPEDSKLMGKVLKTVAANHLTYANLPAKFVVYEESGDTPVAKEITREEFLKQYNFVSDDEEVEAEENEAGYNSAVGGLYAAMLEEDDSDKPKSGKLETKTGFYMVNSDLPYTTSNGKATSYKQPFSIKVMDAKGKKVSIVLPRTVAPADAISHLDSKYAAKYDLDKKLTSITSMVQPVINKYISQGVIRPDQIANKEFNLWVDKQGGKEYGLKYRPDMQGQGGQVIIIPTDDPARVVDMGDMEVLDAYRQLYRTTPFDEE